MMQIYCIIFRIKYNENNFSEGDLYDMCNYKVKIMNCNCIKNAEISVEKGALNIKYGPNGTGKTTISKAIYADSTKSEDIKELRPYMSEDDPIVENNPFQNVMVYNDRYVNQYLFEDRSFLNDSYNVFCKDESLDKLISNAENIMGDLLKFLNSSNELNELIIFIDDYLAETSFNGKSIQKRGGMGELLKGQGTGFSNFSELEPYTAFYDDREFLKVSKWAKWRNDGINEMVDEICPFCAQKIDLDKINKENQIIQREFKKSALEKANLITNLLYEGEKRKFISTESADEIINCMQNKIVDTELAEKLNQLGQEANYLSSKIAHIKTLKPMGVTKEELSEINENIKDMYIEKEYVNKYFSTEVIYGLIDNLNSQIHELEEKTGAIKTLFLKCQEKLEDLILKQERDINEFLIIAGFPYNLTIENDVNNITRVCLKAVGDISNNRIYDVGNHLSWGEKNSFALVMFMFEALSKKADLIILDDPITSFDKDKKFAITRRLFDNEKASFKNKTVLMLTHDLQPIVDFVYSKFLRRYDIHKKVYATYIYNDNGDIKERNIESSSMKNTVELCRSIAIDESKPVAVRIANLRKYFELTNSDYRESDEYEVLSNLIHGRSIDEFEVKIECNSSNDITNILNHGMENVNKYICNMDYNQLYNNTSNKHLLNLVFSENMYHRIIAIRLIFEKKNGTTGLLNQLKTEFPGACKFINETNHIENDYLFQLDPTKFFEIPEYYVFQLVMFLYNHCVDIIEGNDEIYILKLKKLIAELVERYDYQLPEYMTQKMKFI